MIDFLYFKSYNVYYLYLIILIESPSNLPTWFPSVAFLIQSSSQIMSVKSGFGTNDSKKIKCFFDIFFMSNFFFLVPVHNKRIFSLDPLSILLGWTQRLVFPSNVGTWEVFVRVLHMFDKSFHLLIVNYMSVRIWHIIFINEGTFVGKD